MSTVTQNNKPCIALNTMHSFQTKRLLITHLRLLIKYNQGIFVYLIIKIQIVIVYLRYNSVSTSPVFQFSHQCNKIQIYSNSNTVNINHHKRVIIWKLYLNDHNLIWFLSLYSISMRNMWQFNNSKWKKKIYLWINSKRFYMFFVFFWCGGLLCPIKMYPILIFPARTKRLYPSGRASAWLIIFD